MVVQDIFLLCCTQPSVLRLSTCRSHPLKLAHCVLSRDGAVVTLPLHQAHTRKEYKQTNLHLIQFENVYPVRPHVLTSLWSTTNCNLFHQLDGVSKSLSIHHTGTRYNTSTTGSIYHASVRWSRWVSGSTLLSTATDRAQNTRWSRAVWDACDVNDVIHNRTVKNGCVAAK